MTRKQRILDSVLAIPTKNLINHIINGEVSEEEVVSKLRSIGTPNAIKKIAEIEELIEESDENDGARAKDLNTPESYLDYLRKHPQGNFATEFQDRYRDLDESLWTDVKNDLNVDNLNRYKESFPQGLHITECENLLTDGPWLDLLDRQSKGLATIADYEDYINQYPGKHDEEARVAILRIKDDLDWENAKGANTSNAYSQYLAQHPQGKHVSEANSAITARANVDKIISKISEDKNAYSPTDIQNHVKEDKLKWSDLNGFFTDEEINAIEAYKEPTDLPNGEPPEQLQRGNTEVYFWGTPSSGKTCALGAILSAANKAGRLSPKNGPGRPYMDRLKDIFNPDEICVLPKGTPDDSIQEMVCALKDVKKREHKIAFIDLAGEVFRALYNRNNGIEEESSSRQKALEKILGYINDNTNKKIHFFICAYGEEKKKWKSIGMINYLDSAMDYLNTQNIIKKGTNGIYILVTKSDKMPCPAEERKEFAEEYIKEKMPSFYSNLKAICSSAGIGDFEIIPFSIGEVFAQTLCHFEKENSNSVLNKLLFKSRASRCKFLEWLNE